MERLGCFMEDVRFLEELYEVVKQNKEADYSSVIEERASYPYLYHLAGQRQNLVDWIPMTGQRVMEWNPECGALTGKLLARAAEVICVADDEVYAGIIRERCSTAKNLRIVLRDEWNAQAEKPYDVIWIAGSFYRYMADLKMLKSLLKADGCLYIADANRIGLKYLAGCQEEYRGGYFTGVEGYSASDGADTRRGRCYTKQEYIGILEQAGFTQPEFYYPYPDYKFPTSIYSDRRLPERGELSDNRRNFDRDRYQLFEEQNVYETLLQEGLFGEFSNSFLIEVTADRTRERTLYTKYSDERAGRFAIRTDIVEESTGKKYAYKYALEKEGQKHICGIGEAYRTLTEAYRDSGILFCPCESGTAGEGIRFPFIEGRSLADWMQEAGKRRDEVEALLREYIRRVRTCGGNVPFGRTEEFVQVFGEAELEEGPPCARISDIDMIFPNIILGSDKTEEDIQNPDTVWNVIDYEWTFDFPIPKDFIIYRGLYFAYYQILLKNDAGWSLPELFALAGITEAQAAVFAGMEEHFQAYLSRETIPMRNMQRKMGTKIFTLSEPGCGEKERETVLEPDWIKVRKIQYHIDRRDYQDGSVICSGWAFARTKDGRNLPVNIRVTDECGKEVQMELQRTARRDVAETLKIKRVTDPRWGFDCVWIASGGTGWKMHFALGNREETYEAFP